MADPIKIVVVAQAQEAAKELEKIPAAVSQATDETERYNQALQEMAVRQEQARRAAAAAAEKSAAMWSSVGGPAPAAAMDKTSKAADELSKNAFKARMGLLELEHVGRSSVDIMLMGGNSRMLLAQIPQLVQSLSLMGISFGAMLPYIAAVGAAVGVGALEWSIYMSGVEDTTKKLQDMIAALDKVPGILEKIATLQKAGLVSQPAAAQFADYLNGRKKLYVDDNGQVTTSATSTFERDVYRNGPGGATFKMGTETVTRQNREATQAEINDYIQNKLPQVSEAQSKAVDKLNEQLAHARQDALTGIDREIAAVRARYQKEREEIALTLQQAGKLIGPNQYQAAQKQIADLRVSEENAVQDLLAKEQQKRLAEQAASERDLRTQEAERTRNALQTVEDKITAMNQQEGVKRGQFAAVEYSMRLNALQRAYYAGDLGEEEYTHRVAQAQAQRIEGERAYQETVKQTIQLEQEQARTAAQLKLHTIETNPFLSVSSKAAASIGPINELMAANASAISGYQNIAANTADESARIQALTKINDLTLQQVDLQRQLDAAKGEDSFTYQLGLAVTHLEDMNNLAKEVAQSFQTVFNGAIASVSSGITGLVMGTMTWKQFLAEIPRQILTEIVGAIVQMGVRWVATQILMATIGKSIQAASIAANAPMAIATAALWAPAATLSTIATFGASAAAAPGLISLAEGLTLATAGFADGGFTGGIPGQVAGIVHGGEYVFSAPAVQRIGLDNLEAMHQSAVAGNGTGAGGGGNVKATAHVVLVNDRSETLNALKSAAAEEVIVAAVRKNRLKIGIRT